MLIDNALDDHPDSPCGRNLIVGIGPISSRVDVKVSSLIRTSRLDNYRRKEMNDGSIYVDIHNSLTSKDWHAFLSDLHERAALM